MIFAIMILVQLVILAIYQYRLTLSLYVFNDWPKLRNVFLTTKPSSSSVASQLYKRDRNIDGNRENDYRIDIAASVKKITEQMKSIRDITPTAIHATTSRVQTRILTVKTAVEIKKQSKAVKTVKLKSPTVSATVTTNTNFANVEVSKVAWVQTKAVRNTPRAETSASVNKGLLKPIPPTAHHELLTANTSSSDRKLDLPGKTVPPESKSATTKPPALLFSDFIERAQKLKKVDILIMVLTAPSKLKRRENIRKTWWNDCHNIKEVGNLLFYFLIGFQPIFINLDLHAFFFTRSEPQGLVLKVP